MGTARVTSKNQITIPADVRDAFDVQPGDELVFFVKLDGALGVRVRKVRVGAGFGMASNGSSLSDEALDKAIGDAVASGVAERLERC